MMESTVVMLAPLRRSAEKTCFIYETDRGDWALCLKIQNGPESEQTMAWRLPTRSKAVAARDDLRKALVSPYDSVVRVQELDAGIFSALGRRGGRVRAESLSARRRREIAIKASKAAAKKRRRKKH
jgi:hypothetical protein